MQTSEPILRYSDAHSDYMEMTLEGNDD